MLRSYLSLFNLCFRDHMTVTALSFIHGILCHIVCIVYHIMSSTCISVETLYYTFCSPVYNIFILGPYISLLYIQSIPGATVRIIPGYI